MDKWTANLEESKLPTSSDYKLVTTMGDSMAIREWIINGLPNDAVSVENSIYISQGYRWPLLIDP